MANAYNNKGYTLIETLLAVTVTMIVLSAALRLMTFASETAVKAIVRGELMESARTAANVMNSNIQRANEIKIEVNGNNTLRRMELDRPGRTDKFIFLYNPDAPDKTAGYHRLIFTGEGESNDGKTGNNELASNLADVRILSDSSNTIIIEILTDNTITVNNETAKKYINVTAEPVFLRFPVNISGKKRLP